MKCGLAVASVLRARYGPSISRELDPARRSRPDPRTIGIVQRFECRPFAQGREAAGPPVPQTRQAPTRRPMRWRSIEQVMSRLGACNSSARRRLSRTARYFMCEGCTMGHLTLLSPMRTRAGPCGGTLPWPGRCLDGLGPNSRFRGRAIHSWSHPPPPPASSCICRAAPPCHMPRPACIHSTPAPVAYAPSVVRVDVSSRHLPTTKSAWRSRMD